MYTPILGEMLCVPNSLDVMRARWYSSASRDMVYHIATHRDGIKLNDLFILETYCNVHVYDTRNSFLNFQQRRDHLEITVDDTVILYSPSDLFAICYIIDENYAHMTAVHGYNMNELRLLAETGKGVSHVVLNPDFIW